METEAKLHLRHKRTIKAFIRPVHIDSDLRYGHRCPRNQLSAQQ